MINEKKMYCEIRLSTNGSVYREEAIENACQVMGLECNVINCSMYLIKGFKKTEELTQFVDMVNQIEEKLIPKVNLTLSGEQKKVLANALQMLADANIGLAHDYRSTGELMAFNSVDGSVYAAFAENQVEHPNEENWVSADDVEGEPTIIQPYVATKRLYSFYSNDGWVVKKKVLPLHRQIKTNDYGKEKVR